MKTSYNNTQAEILEEIHKDPDANAAHADALLNPSFGLLFASHPVLLIQSEKINEGERESVNRERTWNLGEHAFPNQHRLHKHSITDWRNETRKHWKDVYVTLRHPDINDFWEDAKHCIRVAGTTAVIVAVATENPAAGMKIFYPVFWECLRQRVSERIANETSVELWAETHYSCWTYHC